MTITPYRYDVLRAVQSLHHGERILAVALHLQARTGDVPAELTAADRLLRDTILFLIDYTVLAPRRDERDRRPVRIAV
jgi:hypothetical protein